MPQGFCRPASANEAHIRSDLQRVNNEAGRQKNKAGCYLYLFPPPNLLWPRGTAENGTNLARFSEMFVKCRLRCVALAGAGLLLTLSPALLRADDSTLGVGSSGTSAPQAKRATTNKFAASSCKNVWLETTVPRRYWTDPILLTLTNVQFTLCVTTNGHLAAWNCTNSPSPGDGWTEMLDTKLGSAKSARVELQAIYNRNVSGFFYFRVWLNGTLSVNPQTWYAIEGTTQKQFGDLPAPDNIIVDDLAVTPPSITIPNATRNVDAVSRLNLQGMQSLGHRDWAISDLSSTLPWLVVSSDHSRADASWLFTDSARDSYPSRFYRVTAP